MRLVHIHQLQTLHLCYGSKVNLGSYGVTGLKCRFSYQNCLNTSVTKVLLLLLVPNGVPWNPLKTLSHRNFAIKLAPYMSVLSKTIIREKVKCQTVSKWRPNNRFLFCVISTFVKIGKTAFTKEFFNEIWLKVGEHE